jgi:hypothetical protein
MLQFKRTNVRFAIAANLAFTLCGIGADRLSAQIYPAPSYTEFAKKQYKATQMIAPTFSPRQYTVDRIYYHNPTISPYLNLTRRGGSSKPNYYSYVRPEINRRAAEAKAALPTLGPTPTWAKPPRATPGQAPNSSLAKYYRSPY